MPMIGGTWNADPPSPREHRFEHVMILVFASAICLSAFLLFQVQPLIARIILPMYGGAPSVWTACLLFFQVFLVVGYAYAYVLVRFLSPRRSRSDDDIRWGFNSSRPSFSEITSQFA